MVRQCLVNFSVETTELMADQDRVYRRWIQITNRLSEIDNEKPAGKPLIEVAHCLQRLENNQMVEYWIQNDRQGFKKQLH
jgi:hypothetical protein